MKKYYRELLLSFILIGILYLLRDVLHELYLIPYFILILLVFDISFKFRYNIGVNKLKLRSAYKEILIRLSILFVPIFIYVFLNYSLLLLMFVIQGLFLMIVLIILFNKKDFFRTWVSVYVLFMLLRNSADKIYNMDFKMNWLDQLSLVFVSAIIIYVVYVLIYDLKERKIEKC